MSEWQVVTLADVCDLRAGNPFKREEQGATSGDLPFIKVGDMNLQGNESRVQVANNWVTFPQAARMKLKPFGAGTIVFAKIGEALKQNRVRALTRDTVIDNNMMGAIPRAGVVDSTYFYYLMNTVDFAATATGTALPYLTVSTLKRVTVRIPDLPTQQALGNILERLDYLIENIRRRVEVLEEMARAIYREWFVKFRYPGHEDVPMADSALGPIPEVWEVAAASVAIEVNPRIKLDRSVEHPLITMGDLDERNMGCRPSGVRTEGSGAKFQQGDTLFARITPCLQNGKTGLVQSLAEGEVGLGSTEFVVLRGRLVGQAFTYCFAREDSFRGHAIASMSGASGRQRVRNECFDSYPLAVPPRWLVNAFETTVEPLMSQAAVLFDESGRLRTLRDMLLPELVTGQVDVSSLNLNTMVSTGSNCDSAVA